MKTRAKIAGALVGCTLLVGSAVANSAAVELPSTDELSLQQVLDIARVEAPPPGVGLLLTLHWPDGHPFVLDGTEVYALSVDITPDDHGVIVRNAVANEGPGVDGPAGACEDPTFAPMGVVWAEGSMPVKWRANAKSIPDRLSTFATLRSMRKAHQVWPRIKTDCRDDDSNQFHFSFRGLTNGHVGYNGRNVIDFGKLGSRALAVNYTYYKRTKIIEVDLRLNKFDYRWTNKAGGSKGYNVLNVVTHELGHQLGLDDLGEPHQGLTMFGRIAAGEFSKTTLGKGDIKGAATLSPKT